MEKRRHYISRLKKITQVILSIGVAGFKSDIFPIDMRHSPVLPLADKAAQGLIERPASGRYAREKIQSQRR